MDENLRANAERLLGSAPCSAELPAGTGKTHVLCAAAAVAANRGHRSLILTHTHAGVDAIRRRMRSFDVPSSLFRVDTLTSWAFSLVKSYSQIAGVAVSDVPDWSRSAEYINGAASVADSNAIADMHRASFDYLFVDEYQDCSLAQHEFVLAMTRALPKSIVLGDRLQAIFKFDGPVASWDSHVLPNFPAYDLEVEPHRWARHNVDLGRWILDVRPRLAHGQVFDVANHIVPGLTFVHGSGAPGLAAVAHSFHDFNESVLLLDKWAPDVARHASRLGGRYSVMEDISGQFMLRFLETLPVAGDSQLAAWFATFAKACVVGLGGIDAPVLKGLAHGRTVGHYSRPGLEPVLVALDQLVTAPTYEQLDLTAEAFLHTSGLRVFRWEAWNDTRESIRMTIENGEPAWENLGHVRDRLRRSGRQMGNRVASRTLLVKGLEFDHVVIADLSKMTDPCNLYVALSRARTSVTILGNTSRITLEDRD